MDLRRKKILVTGGHGFLGKHLIAQLESGGIPRENIFAPRSTDVDFRNFSDCERAVHNRDVVFHLAARVGGIGFNEERPGEIYYDNVIMGAHMIEAARRANVEKFIGVSTICAYPKFTPVPFREEDLWIGYPEETNAPYGLAKKMMLVQSQAYRKQYGMNGIYLLLLNLYGPGDNFDSSSSHVIPALIRKVYEAKRNGAPYIEVWGTGKATRGFLHVTDAARGIVLAAERYDKADPINLGTALEISIKELVAIICRLMDYRGEIKWDVLKPDGQPRRMLDTTRAAKEFGFRANTNFEDGLRKTIDWYRATAR